MADEYVNWGNPLTARDKSEEDPTWGDYGKALGSGVVSIGTGAAALAEYAGEAIGSESLANFGRTGRDLGNTANDQIIESMTEPAQRALGASFLPGDDDISAYDDLGSSLGLKVTAALPSLIASVVPGGVAARAFGTLAGTIAGSAAGATLNAGDVANTIYSEFDKQSDDELRASNPMYDAYRLGGMDEKEARAAVRQDVIGYAPALAFVFTAATSKFGPEGAVARIFGGDAKAGAVRGLMRGYLGEAGQEGSEGFFNEYLQGNAAATGGYGEFDQGKAWEQALEGALIGGILGAPFGAVEGMSARAPRVDPNPDTSRTKIETAPPAGPDITQAAAIAAQPVAPKPAPAAAPAVGPKGRKVKSSKKVTEAAPPVQEVPVGGLSADEQAAAVATQDNQIVPPSPQMQAQQLAEELAAIQTPQAQAPVQAPVEAPAAPVAPNVLEAQQLAQELPQVPTAQAPAPAVDPVPEQTQTIDAQREQLVGGERKAVLYTPNQPVPPELPGMKRIKVKDQIWDYNPKQITAKDIRAAVKAKRENEILDLGSVAKQDMPVDAPEVAVVARDNMGVETRAAVGTPDTAPQQLAEMQATQKSNEAQIAIEPADQVIVERLQNPPKAAKAKAASKARTPVKAPEIVVVPTGEAKIGPEGKKIIEVESAVAKQQREAALAEIEQDANKNDVDMSRGNRDAGTNAQAMSDRKSRERFITRVETELKKGDKAAPWAKQADAVRKKFGDKLGRGKKAPAGYYDALQAAHEAEVSTRAVEPAPEKPLTKKEAAKQATAEKRAAEAAKTAEEKAAELETKINESTTLSMKNKATLRAVLANDKQTMAERVETAELAMRQFAEASGDAGGTDVTARGSGSKGGDRGLSIDAAREEGFDIVEAIDNIDEAPDALLAGDIGELTATDEDVLAAAKSLEETYEATQEPITRERPTVELAEGEGFTAVTETKPVNKVENPLAQLKPKVSGKISLNKTVKVVGEKSNLRGNTRQSFSTPSGQVFTPLQSTTVGAMLDRLNFDHLNGLARVLAPKLRKALRQSAANVQLHIIDETQMRAVDPTNPRGFYLHSGHVFIRADQLAENGAAYAIMHEAVHAAFLNAMRSKPAIAKMVERMRKATLDHHFGGDQVLGEEFYYGFENADEFLAEAMSNPDFQDLLAQTPMPEDMARELGFDTGSRFSLWNALVEEIRKWLGLGNSDRVMLEGIMRIGQKLESVAARANAQSTSTGISALRAEDITSEVKTRAKVAGEGMTGVAIKAMTLDFMRQKFGGLFNGAFDRYVEAVQQRDNIVNTVADLHDKDAAEFIELMRRNPDEGVAMADLAMDATRLDVNLGPNADNSHLGKNSKKGIQARKRIDELQARYDALQPETQELMQRMTANYRETHNANVTALAYNVLSELPVKLSNSDLMQLLDKVTSGTLTDEDAKIVGDPTIFNSLRRSTELKTIKGMYFPNMRFGDHVVLTREKVTAPDIKKVELRGGKLANVRTELVGDNTVRFIGDPSIRGVSTALMRLADDFVAKSDLPLVAYRKRSMDRTTGEVVSASEERSDREYDVVYEVELRNQGVHFFDSATEAEKFRASSKSEKTSQVLDRRADQVQQMISSSALANVVRAIEGRKDLPETRRKQMRNVLEAAIVANLPGNRAEARYQARRNVKGASKDVGRAALAYGRAAGNFQATLQTAPAQRNALRDMTEIEDATKFGENAATISKVMNEIRAREAVIDGPLNRNKFFQDVATLSFFDKLVSPAYNIVNFQQVIMNSLPVLGGRYGLWKTNSAIMSAYKRVGTLETILSGAKNTAAAAAQWNRTAIDTTDLLGSMRKNLGPKYEPLVELLIKRGAISPDIGLEIAAALSEGRGAWGQGLSKFDRIARQLPGAVEAVNRMVSAVATYDLAVASGKSHQAAMQEAFDVTLNTQGDYRGSNSPRFMNDGKLAWALQFKKFAVLQTQLMGDMFYRAMKDASPEERAIARKQLAIMVGVQVMYAGALGLPGLELAKLVFTMGAALGLSDGWEDQERRVKQILADSIGKTPAELITSGVVSRAIGIDVSKRMSQADLWTGFAPKSYDAAGISQYIGTAILGAPGATAIDWMSASKELVKGDVLKALELAVPVKTFADTVTAVRKYQEGKYSPTDAALKVIGFTSARQARISEETGNRIKDRKAAKAQQDELVKSYLNARSAADRVKAKSKIREFNKNVPEGGRKISINGLDRILEEQRQILAIQ